MLLQCQLDAYAREGTSDVLSCDAVEGGFEVELADGVLYPEGGGQPADHGTIDGVAVVDVQRRGGRLLARALAEVAPGRRHVVVDWDRRFDHMQQHTAQHLLTAVLLSRFQVATIGFHLGAERSFVDLSRELLPEEAQQALDDVNRVIREARPVTHRVVDDLDGVRSRRVAEGVEELRVVSIAGVDDNTCGGTHVANTAELQLVVGAGIERIKGDKGRMSFLAGGRVAPRLTAVEGTLGALQRTLTTGEVQSAVEKLLRDQKSLDRSLRSSQQELAGHVGDQVAGQPGPLRALHRPAADASFLQAVATRVAARHPADLVWLTSETDFLLVGPPDRVTRLRAELLAAVGARGGGPPGKVQGRCTQPATHELGLRALEA